MTLGAESSQSGSHVITIIQTSPWLVWLPPQRFIKSCSHLEPRVPLLTYALDFSSYALDFSSPYALEHLCRKPEGYSAWVFADRPLVEAWDWIIFGRHLVARSNRLAGGSQTSSFMQSSALSLVLVKVYWLDDKSLTSASQARWHRSLGVTRDNRTWHMYTSETILEQLRAR